MSNPNGFFRRRDAPNTSEGSIPNDSYPNTAPDVPMAMAQWHLDDVVSSGPTDWSAQSEPSPHSNDEVPHQLSMYSNDRTTSSDWRAPAQPMRYGHGLPGSSYDPFTGFPTASVQSFHSASNAPVPRGYSHLVACYESFWERRYLTAISQGNSISDFKAHPIQIPKVIEYLQSELSANPSLFLGSSNVSDVINALDKYRSDHRTTTTYAADTSQDFSVSLRADPRIFQLEDIAARRLPPTRPKPPIPKPPAPPSPQTVLYRDCKTFVNMLREPDGRDARVLDRTIRDRMMILLEQGMSPRMGNNVYLLKWSDYMLKQVTIDCNGVSRQETTLAILAKDGKLDAEGRVLTYGAIRHRFAEMCPIAGLGFCFYSYFHIANNPVPDFTVCFTNRRHQEYGLRKWLYCAEFITETLRNICLFVPEREVKSGDTSTAMTRTNFGAKESELYNFGRETLEPPAALISFLFPWIEKEQLAYDERLRLHGARAKDDSLEGLFRLLIFLRKVILQDAVVLYLKYPDCHIFKHQPLDCLEFHYFAERSKAILTTLGEERKVVLPNPRAAVVDPPPESLQEIKEVLDWFSALVGDESSTDDMDALRASLTATATSESTVLQPQRHESLFVANLPKRTQKSKRLKPTFTSGFYASMN